MKATPGPEALYAQRCRRPKALHALTTCHFIGAMQGENLIELTLIQLKLFVKTSLGDEKSGVKTFLGDEKVVHVCTSRLRLTWKFPTWANGFLSLRMIFDCL